MAFLLRKGSTQTKEDEKYHELQKKEMREEEEKK